MQVQEIHTTLHKHLAKEEEQLLPLLLQHFTHAEQVGQRESCVLVCPARGGTVVAWALHRWPWQGATCTSSPTQKLLDAP